MAPKRLWFWSNIWGVIVQAHYSRKIRNSAVTKSCQVMVRNPIWYTSYLLSAVSFFLLNVMLAGGGASSADPGERSCWHHQSGAEGQTTSGEASHRFISICL